MSAWTREAITMVVVLFVMFAALMSDLIGADIVMLSALAVCLVTEIITIEEGLAGFANEGLLTVVALFVVAQGISKTGGLDWYMSKLLGTPKTVASAQLRLMLPIAIVSAFLNNTPVVAVMIGIVQRWGENNGIPLGQLMIPLSFASILGGTCTLIGTSTNLVVEGMLTQRYGRQYPVGLFSLGLYGVPVALSGLAYVVFFSPHLLPGGRAASAAGSKSGIGELLVGARVMPWSKAIGKSVRSLGLRDRTKLYLIRVQKMGSNESSPQDSFCPDLVLEDGDVLWFTGMVEQLGDVCKECGLQPVTSGSSESSLDLQVTGAHAGHSSDSLGLDSEESFPEVYIGMAVDEQPVQRRRGPLHTRTSLRSIRSSASASLRARGLKKLDSFNVFNASVNSKVSAVSAKEQLADLKDKIKSAHSCDADDPEEDGDAPQPDRVVLLQDDADPHTMLTLGIDTMHQVGLLHDISRGLSRLHVTLVQSEVAVVRQRSFSLWRCQLVDGGQLNKTKMGEIANLTSQRLSWKSVAVVRATVNDGSWLAGRLLADVYFRKLYGANVVTLQRGSGPVASSDLSELRLKAGDIIIFQVEDDSPLLQPRPRNDATVKTLSLRSRGSFMPRSPVAQEDSEPDMDRRRNVEEAWKDLTVHSRFNNLGAIVQGSASVAPEREFLTAMLVKKRSAFIGQTVTSTGLKSVPGLFLVSHERIKGDRQSAAAAAETGEAELATVECEATQTLSPEETIASGDVLWFAGSASAVRDLRKVPGLEALENQHVEKVASATHQRRLVQAVVARSGPLVGHRIRDIRFAARFGAAIVAVHREGLRVHREPNGM
eukprot:TRINITY_DN25968_c0_g1_i2.p1 TRINITY_DN25968_c0_g1~~TRINITY_DN25968_c0_g1_i2.p1  ORF type:complete len:843 (+),score=141.41 TRINITY_DN25968_c0_g1_i2:53-2530(+)